MIFELHRTSKKHGGVSPRGSASIREHGRLLKELRSPEHLCYCCELLEERLSNLDRVGVTLLHTQKIWSPSDLHHASGRHHAAAPAAPAAPGATKRHLETRTDLSVKEKFHSCGVSPMFFRSIQAEDASELSITAKSRWTSDSVGKNGKKCILIWGFDFTFFSFFKREILIFSLSASSQKNVDRLISPLIWLQLDLKQMWTGVFSGNYWKKTFKKNPSSRCKCSLQSQFVGTLDIRDLKTGRFVLAFIFSFLTPY